MDDPNSLGHEPWISWRQEQIRTLDFQRSLLTSKVAFSIGKQGRLQSAATANRLATSAKATGRSDNSYEWVTSELRKTSSTRTVHVHVFVILQAPAHGDAESPLAVCYQSSA
eukprot:scaffold616510_cov19-Prasinocladus_malaysianus.AAC.1